MTTTWFHMSDVVTGTQLVGREEEVRERLLDLWLNTGPAASVLIYGPRRIGRSSLLWSLADLAPAQLAVAYVNLQGLLTCGNSRELLHAIVAEVDRALAQWPARRPGTIKRFLAEIPGDAAFTASLRAFCRRVTPRRLVLAFDESEAFDVLIADGRLPDDFPARFRNLLDSLPVIQVWARVAGPSSPSGDTPAGRSLTTDLVPVRLGRLAEAAVYQLLQPVGLPWDYEPAALERLYELSGGLPALVQTLGGALGIRLAAAEDASPPAGDRPCVTLATVEELVRQPEFYHLLRYNCAGWWYAATANKPAQQALLEALWRYPRLTLAQAQTITAGYEQPADTALAALAAEELLEDDGGGWRYTSDLFRLWSARLYQPRELHLVSGPEGAPPTADQTIWTGRAYDLPLDVLAAALAGLEPQGYQTWGSVGGIALTLRDGDDCHTASAWLASSPPAHKAWLRWRLSGETSGPAL